MIEKLSKEKTEIFDHIIKSFNLALMNSALYSSGHSAFGASVEFFKEALDKWFTLDEKLDLGISPDNILLGGEPVKEDNELYGNVADYLHKKGLMSLSFRRGIGADELLKFFSFLKNGASAKNIAETPNLIIKELDYSSFLTSADAASAMEEKDIWRSLSEISKELQKGQLPGSKAEFLNDFLKDPKKAAATLSKIYKDALATLDRESAAKEIRAVFTEISRYFDEHPGSAGKNTKKELARIVSHLDPGLVMSLLEDEGTGGGLPGLADRLFGNLSDDATADFMASLMRNANNVNEKMIKLFSRLIPGQDRAESVLPMVADKLFQEKLLNRDALSSLQSSIKDLFESHPDDTLIARIYSLTVEAFIDKEKGPAFDSRKNLALVEGYKEFLKEDNLKKEKIKLLLNILWLEDDPAKFKKMADILSGSFLQMLKPEYVEITKKAFEFLVEKLSFARTNNAAIARTIQDTLDKISEVEITDKLASFIPGSARTTLDDIVYILINANRKAAILEMIDKERGPEDKKKIFTALVRTKDAEIIKRLFDKYGRQGFFKNSFLTELITLCGAFKAAGSTEYLKNILERRPFFYTKTAKGLRLQSALSLGMIGTPEAVEIIKKFSRDPDNSVRAVCTMILESGAAAHKEAALNG